MYRQNIKHMYTVSYNGFIQGGEGLDRKGFVEFLGVLVLDIA